MDGNEPKKSSPLKWILGGCLGCGTLALLALGAFVFFNLETIEEGIEEAKKTFGPTMDIQAALEDELGVDGPSVRLHFQNSERHLRIELTDLGTSGLEGRELAQEAALIAARLHPEIDSFSEVQITLAERTGVSVAYMETTQSHTFLPADLLEQLGGVTEAQDTEASDE